MNRINLIQSQLSSSSPFPQTSQLSPNDPVIVSAIRSPITKSKKGLLHNTSSEEILSQLLHHIILTSNIPPSSIDEIIIGNALQNGSAFLSSRAAQKLISLPDKVPLYTVNRLCNSGLQSIINAHNSIKSGQSKIVIAGGVESMSLFDFSTLFDKNHFTMENILSVKEVQNLIIPMGITNENICERFNISRQDQDEFAYNSHMKAAKAQRDGIFKKEIKEIITAKGEIVEFDDIIRPNTTIEGLKKLKAVFKENGTTTAGNASPLSDGGALCLLTTRKIANEMNMEVLGKIVAYNVVGVPSDIMGIGPSVAIPAVLKMAGFNMEDIDLFEINEAFAGQALYCIRKLGVPKEKLNVHGGAIAIGHPLGCTGARMVVGLLNALKIYNKRRGIVSMCIGTGMGAACIIGRD